MPLDRWLPAQYLASYNLARSAVESGCESAAQS